MLFLILPDDDIGKILTWNIDGVTNKFDLDGGVDIKDVVCSYVGDSDIVALQGAGKFQCNSFNDFKSAETGQFITMVKSNEVNPIQLLDSLKLSSSNQPFGIAVRIQAADVNNGEPVAVVNVRYSYSKKDQQIVETVNYVKGTLTTGQYNMIVVLGEFNEYTETDLKDLLSAITKPANSVLKLDPKAPITTCDGHKFHNILLNKSKGTKVQLNLPEFSADADFSANEKAGDFTLHNLVNNYVTLSAFRKDVSNVQKCLNEYVSKKTKRSPPCHNGPWVSSRMISDHLPLQLKIKLIEQQADLSIGTWNIEGQPPTTSFKDANNLKENYLSWKLNDPDIQSRITNIVQKFDILVFQELVVDDKNLQIHQMKSNQGPEHGYFMQNRRNVKITVDVGGVQHFHEDSSQTENRVTRIPFIIQVPEKNPFQICLYSVHFSDKAATQSNIRSSFEKLQQDAQTYSNCHLHLALGDFNVELYKWPEPDRKKIFGDLDNIITCEGTKDGAPFKYTKVDTRKRLDYIIVLNKGPLDKTKIDTKTCNLLLTGSQVPSGVNIDDWREISRQYPLQVELVPATRKCPSCTLIKKRSTEKQE